MDCPVLIALHALPDAPIAVGFSGGLDSSVLLHALSRIRPRAIEALHVDHGLQPDSARWAQHCLRQAADWGVPCRILRAEVEPAHPDGLEAAARAARYASFATALPADGLLALAHHQDDQAETVLLRLLRRAGPRGLAAMRPLSRGDDGLWRWRPLLDVPRTALQAYAERFALPALDDPMNADPRFDRVFLRCSVLPALQSRWPGSSAALAASAGLLAGEDQRRDAAVRAALAHCRGLDPASVLLAPLAATDPLLRRPLLHAWLSELGAPSLPGALLQRLADGLAATPDRGFPSLRWAGWQIERYRDELRAAPAGPTDFAERSWDGREPLQLPGGELCLLGRSALPWAAMVRPRRGGERLALPGRGHHHSLKTCLQALGIPPWERRGLPLLFDPDGQLAAAGDLLYSARFDAWLGDAGARLRWTPC